MKSFKPSTALALQASAALTVLLIFGHFLPLQRSYWAIVSAMLLVSQTFGEGLRKSAQRIAMTILGGALATWLYFLTHQHPVLWVPLLLACVFMMVYYLEASYQISIFFATMAVVFLFAMLNAWSTDLLIIRVYETLLGALAAILSSALIFPVRAYQKFKQEAVDFLKVLQALNHEASETPFRAKRDLVQVNQMHADLIARYINLKKNERFGHFENFLFRTNQGEFYALTDKIFPLFFYSVNAQQVALMLPLQEAQGELFKFVQQMAMMNQACFEAILAFLQDGKKDLAALQICNKVKLQDVANNMELASKESTLNAKAFLYNLMHAHEALQRLINDLKFF
ncbi:MAG: hypothetical protein K0S08_1594 [Gammaproteobacteria bacterium]|jgi:uncharacterized membrane protein YgaE (UPF0421/DUF939 family)|nr:hypothetical protein [Gammaproteobacteria bacterium]